MSFVLDGVKRLERKNDGAKRVWHLAKFEVHRQQNCKNNSNNENEQTKHEKKLVAEIATVLVPVLLSHIIASTCCQQFLRRARSSLHPKRLNFRVVSYY